jgi:hypothetical protein
MTNEFLEAAETVGDHFVSGVEANALLFILDTACSTNLKGIVTEALSGLTLAETKKLRDKLFSIHEHRPECSDCGDPIVSGKHYCLSTMRESSDTIFDGWQCDACGSPFQNHVCD